MASSERITTGNLARILGVSSQTVRKAAKELCVHVAKSENGKGFVFTQEQARDIAAKLNRPFSGESMSADAERKAREMAEELLETYKKTVEEYKGQIAQKDEELRQAREQIQEERKRIDTLLETVNNLSASTTVAAASSLIVRDDGNQKSRWQRLKEAWRG